MQAVNNVPANRADAERDNSIGFVLGIMFLIAFIFLLLFYGVPAMRNTTSKPLINIPQMFTE